MTEDENYYETYMGEIPIELEDPITQDSSLHDVFFKKTYGGWSEAFEKNREVIDNVIEILDNQIKKNKELANFYPLKRNLLKALELTPLHKVKIVIWGQDPYPTILDNGKIRAQGMSFSVSREDKIPKSLINIFKEIKETYPDFNIPTHGDLKEWAEQGILLLNTGLTYSPAEKDITSKKRIHIRAWKRLICLLIEQINNHVNNCIHVLWGKDAQKLTDIIKTRDKFILISGHPSPCSVHQFRGNNHFLKINLLLRELGKEQIDFRLSEEDGKKTGKPTYLEFASKARIK